jgi:hypothetical protein
MNRSEIEPLARPRRTDRYSPKGIYGISAMRRLDYSAALMSADRITLAHFSVSSTINFPNSAGIIGIGTPPRSAKRALILGSAKPSLIWLLS